MTSNRRHSTSTSRKPKAKAAANGRDDVAGATGPERSVCVYCGSGPGAKPIYTEAARELGQGLAQSGIGLVYGGGGMGLMGEVARATLDAGGHVTGIIPKFLTEKEHALTTATELIVTADMHERKKLMFDRSDAFVALPGGIGTLEELVEQLTWSQLGRHTKPIIVANIDNFWDPFLNLLAHMKQDAFIRAGLDLSFTVIKNAGDVVPALQRAWAVGNGGVADEAVLARF